jgi:hypothetical protein
MEINFWGSEGNLVLSLVVICLHLITLLKGLYSLMHPLYDKVMDPLSLCLDWRRLGARKIKGRG